MARIRSIKPDFFLDPHMDSVSERHQKLYQGLWTLADKEGRLHDEPRRIKAQVFPYREYDVDEMLSDLADSGFIIRYVVADIACIAIPKFGEHQRPHPKELALGLPHPPDQELANCREKKRQAVKRFSTIPSSPARKGREGVSVVGKGAEERPKPKEAPPESSGELREKLEATFLKAKGYAYDWRELRDEPPIREVIHHGEAEIDRRWGIALRRVSFPKCATVKELVQHWTHYGEEDGALRRPGLRSDTTDARFEREMANVQVDAEGNVAIP